MEHENNIWGGPQGIIENGKEKTTHTVIRTHQLMESFNTPIDEIIFSLHDKNGAKIGEMELNRNFKSMTIPDYAGVVYYRDGKWSTQPIAHHHKTIKEIKFKFKLQEQPQFTEESLSEHEKSLIIKTLKKYKQNRRKSAKALEVSERTFYRKIKKYNI